MKLSSGLLGFVCVACVCVYVCIIWDCLHSFAFPTGYFWKDWMESGATREHVFSVKENLPESGANIKTHGQKMEGGKLSHDDTIWDPIPNHV